jgi:hypothetical protein
MDIRERHFGRIATEDGDPKTLVVDVGALVRRLILFEQCTIESIMLKEVPALIAIFGVRGFLTLLDSGAVRIVCDAMTAGQVGQLAFLKTTANRGGPLPLGSYRIASVGIPPEGQARWDYVHQALQEVHRAAIPLKEVRKVKRALASRLLTYSSDAANAGVSDTQAELLQRHPVFWEAIRHAVMTETGIDPGSDPDFEVEDLGHDGDVRVTTDLVRKHGLSSEQVHKLVERGILAVAGMNQRIQLMKSFEAVTGFQEDEVQLFEKKLSFLVKQLDPTAQEQRFERIATIGGLPNLDGLPAGTTIDVDRLLKIRDDAECRELRTWLRNVDSETDEEINARFESVRAHLASAIEGRGGRIVRFLVTSGVGAIPVVGAAAGPLANAADSFLLEKVVGKPGPATFLSKNYRSIFKD